MTVAATRRTPPADSVSRKRRAGRAMRRIAGLTAAWSFLIGRLVPTRLPGSPPPSMAVARLGLLTDWRIRSVFPQEQAARPRGANGGTNEANPELPRCDRCRSLIALADCRGRDPGAVPRNLCDDRRGARSRCRRGRSCERSRLAGFVAAFPRVCSFDFFLTEPYERFARTHRPEIETAIRLFVVGIVVTDLAARNVFSTESQSRRPTTSGSCIYLAGWSRPVRRPIRSWRGLNRGAD